MGDGIQVLCEKCTYSNMFLLGSGMNYSSLENIKRIIHHSRWKTIQNILNNHKLIEGTEDYFNPTFYHELYQCSSCNNLTEKLYIKIDYEQDGELKTYETSFTCPKCKKPLSPIGDEDIENIPCPECKNKSLMAIGGILWD